MARVHLKCCTQKCITSATRWRHFSYSETSKNYDERHGKFTFLNTTHTENMVAVCYCAGVPLSDDGTSQQDNALIGQLL